jgi:hypothetical protein
MMKKVKQTNANKKWEILNEGKKKTEMEHTWNKALEVVASKTS